MIDKRIEIIDRIWDLIGRIDKIERMKTEHDKSII